MGRRYHGNLSHLTILPFAFSTCSDLVSIFNFHFITELAVHVQFYGSMDEITPVHDWQVRSHTHLVTHGHSFSLHGDPVVSQDLCFKQITGVGRG